MNEPISSKQQLSQMIVGSWITQAIYVAAELGVADAVADGAGEIGSLARRTGAQAEPLHRVLRALASVGIFAEGEPGRFSLTPLAEHLRSGATDSQRPLAIMAGTEFYRSWGELLYSAKTGRPAFDKVFGAPFFEYMAGAAERGRIYDAAMAGFHGAESEALLDAYPVAPFETVADVGGGNGSQLAAILQRHPQVAGILFDLPSVARRARDLLSDAGLLDRCRVVEGDFFRSVPQGADVYILRHIIHDWDDESAVTILRNCRDAMGPAGKVLVAENVIAEGNGPAFGKWLDLMMLVVGGRERTEAEYGRLFSRAGLVLTRVVSTGLEVSVIEGVRAG